MLGTSFGFGDGLSAVAAMLLIVLNVVGGDLFEKSITSILNFRLRLFLCVRISNVISNGDLRGQYSTRR